MIEVVIVNREQLINELSDGRMFTVDFMKKDNTRRKINARLGVRKHLKNNGVKNYDDAEKNLLTVYSLDSGGYRSVPVDRINEIRAHGRVYRIRA